MYVISYYLCKLVLMISVVYQNIEIQKDINRLQG